MASKTWSGKITPESGNSGEDYIVGVSWVDLGATMDGYDLSSGFLATAWPDLDGNWSLTFDDANIPAGAMTIDVNGTPTPALSVVIHKRPWAGYDSWIFSYYDPDGNVIVT